jgi:hypothetical protein
MKITCKMITAGNDALAERWVELTCNNDSLSVIPNVVAEIWIAMEAARKAEGLAPRLGRGSIIEGEH